MPLKITILMFWSKVYSEIWYCLTDQQLVAGGSHGAPAHPECSPNVGAPTFPGCAVYSSSSSSSSLTTTSLRGQRAHLRDRHLLPAQRHVLQRLLLHLLRTTSPTAPSANIEHRDTEHTNVNAAAGVQQCRRKQPTSDASSPVQCRGCRPACPVHHRNKYRRSSGPAVHRDKYRGTGAVQLRDQPSAVLHDVV